MRALASLILVMMVTPLAVAQAENPYGESPIRVHIDGGDDGYLPDVLESLDYWARGGNGALAWTPSFVRVDNASNAHIVVGFVSHSPCGSPTAAGCAGTVEGDARTFVLLAFHHGGRADGPRVSHVSMKQTARHEFGHALGLAHTEDANDIMYFRLHDIGPRADEGDATPMIAALVVTGILLVLGGIFVRRYTARARDTPPAAACVGGSPYHDFDGSVCRLCGREE